MINYSLLIFLVITLVALIWSIIRAERYKKKLDDKIAGDLNVIWDLDDTGAPNAEPLVFAIFKADPRNFKSGDPVTLIVSVKNTF